MTYHSTGVYIHSIYFFRADSGIPLENVNDFKISLMASHFSRILKLDVNFLFYMKRNINNIIVSKSDHQSATSYLVNTTYRQRLYVVLPVFLVLCFC